MPILRCLSVAVLCAALAPATLAQQAVPGSDCNHAAISEGQAPDASCATARSVPEVAASRLISNAPSFGHDDENSAFVRFVDESPAFYDLVSPFNPADFVNAGDFRGNDLTTWYGLQSDGRAFTVDANTGIVTQLGRINPPQDFTWTALTWDYENEVFYALAARCGNRTGLFTIDFDRMRRTEVAPANQGLLCGIALAADPFDGTLYAYGLNRNELATVNKNNGVVTEVGPLDFDPNYGQEMDFNNLDGTLFAYAYNNDTERGELRTVDTATGNTTFIGRLGGALPGGRNQIGAGSSRTPFGDFSVTASSLVESVPQGASIPVSYQVCNGRSSTLTGTLSYQARFNGTPVTPEVTVGSGSVASRSCIPELSFNIDVASDAPVAVYTIDIIATANNGTTKVATLPLVVTPASAAAVVEDWSASDAQPWPALEGEETVTAAATAAPGEIAAFPNPFARETTLSFSLTEAADVRLTVYDVLGREVAVLLDGEVEAGVHTATFDARGLATGSYVYRLVAGETVQSGQITLVK